MPPKPKPPPNKKQASKKKGLLEEVDDVVATVAEGVDDVVDTFAAGMADLVAELPKPPPIVHLDLCKTNKKLTTYYEEISELPVDDARFYKTYLAKHKASGEYRSVRIVLKKGFPKEEVFGYVEAYKKLYHPNIMHLYETLEDRQHYYFISDRVDRPNIYQAIPKLFPNPKDFDETQIALVARTILRTLEFCHKNKFPHTNLTYHNILVPPKGGLKRFYLVGFGYARLHRRDDIYDKSTELDESDKSTDAKPRPPEEAVGMAPKDLFAAPETRWGELSVFEEPADIWSVGIITFQLLTRHHPYEDPKVRPRSFEDKAWRNDFFHNHKFLTNVSAPARDFLNQMLTYKDFERPTATQALQHEWLKIAERVGGTAKKEQLLDRLDNLANFDAKNKLEQSARVYMATNLLHVKEKAALDSIFRHLEPDREKGLTKGALKVAFEKAHGQEKSVKVEEMLVKTFDRLDKEKKGVINYNQFLAAAADDSMLLTKRNLRTTFDAIDKSKTGTLTVDDLKDFFTQLDGQKKKLMGGREVRRIIKEVAGDGDREISFEDFCDLMKSRS